MTNTVRLWFYIILGGASSVAFFLRFVIQWIYSERQKKSTVPLIFWKLSLFGNITLILHYFIQGQFPFAWAQSFNTAFSWRNINLMSESPLTFKQAKKYIFYIITLIPLLYIIQTTLLYKEIIWMNTPLFNKNIPFSWHYLGFTGAFLFSLRFWIQWLQSENKNKSELGATFWWLSIFGSLLTTIYGIICQDIVIIVGYSIGIIPYVRNIILLSKK
jgi:lipid-A-disaccharide synthase-like uncharacterized protein